MSSSTSETAALFVGALVVVGLLAACLALAGWAAYTAHRNRRAEKALRRDVLTTTRNMVRMLNIVVRLDPNGTLGREAAGMAATLRAAEVRIGSGVSPEGGPLPPPKPPEIVEPLSLEEQWALDCEANEWCDADGIPLPEVEKSEAVALVNAYRGREARRKKE